MPIWSILIAYRRVFLKHVEFHLFITLTSDECRCKIFLLTKHQEWDRKFLETRLSASDIKNSFWLMINESNVLRTKGFPHLIDGVPISLLCHLLNGRNFVIASHIACHCPKKLTLNWFSSPVISSTLLKGLSSHAF